MSWLGNFAALDSLAEASPVILSCTGFYGPRVATWPILPTRPGRLLIRKKKRGWERIGESKRKSKYQRRKGRDTNEASVEGINRVRKADWRFGYERCRCGKSMAVMHGKNVGNIPTSGGTARKRMESYEWLYSGNRRDARRNVSNTRNGQFPMWLYKTSL